MEVYIEFVISIYSNAVYRISFPTDLCTIVIIN